MREYLRAVFFIFQFVQFYMSNSKEDQERFDFEQALERLSEVLSELESDEVPLEKAIALYEEGMKLSRLCSKKLEEAEIRIQQVSENDETRDDET